MAHYSMHRRAFIGGTIAATAAAVLGRPDRAAARGRWWSSLVFGVFENHGFDDVAGLPSHRRLAGEGTVLTGYFAVSHPSGPNYRALISGEVWAKAQLIDTFHPSIASQAATLVPSIPTFVYHLAGEIAHRHNPFVDLRAPIAAIGQGLPALKRDLQETLPEAAVVYVGWDDRNNMHDGDPDLADRNLTALLDLLASSRWFTTPDREGRYPAMFFCYDEAGAANRVFAAWWGRGVRKGLASSHPHTHYSFCRTVTDNWGLPPLMRAAGVPPIAEAWT